MKTKLLLSCVLSTLCCTLLSVTFVDSAVIVADHESGVARLKVTKKLMLRDTSAEASSGRDRNQDARSIITHSYVDAPNTIHVRRGGIVTIFVVETKDGQTAAVVNRIASDGASAKLSANAVDRDQFLASALGYDSLYSLSEGGDKVFKRVDISMSDTDTTLELLLGADSPRSTRIRLGVPLPGGLRAQIGGGLMYLSDNARTFNTIPEYDPVTNNRVQINGQDASRIVRNSSAFNISTINAGAYYVFDEDNRVSQLVSGLEFFQRLGIEIVIATSGSDPQTYRLGMSLFFDREATIAFNFGVSFRRSEILVGQREGNLVVNQQLNKLNDWTTGFDWGITYGIAIGRSE